MKNPAFFEKAGFFFFVSVCYNKKKATEAKAWN